MEDEETKKPSFTIVLSNETIPAIDDYSIDEDIELKLIAKVKKIAKPEQNENEIKSVEPSKFTLEVREVEIINKKQDRKTSEEMGLDIKDYKKLQSKRRGGTSSPM